MNSGGIDILMEDFDVMCEKCVWFRFTLHYGEKNACVWTNDKGQAQVRRIGFLCGETSSPLSI